MKKKLVTHSTLNVWLNNDFDMKASFELPAYFKAPISLVWELTGKCMSSCIYCSGGFPRKTVELTHEEKIRLARELIDLKIFMISLSGGDPLLCDDLEEIVSLFTENGINVMLCTPGLYVEEEKIARLCKNTRVSFNISIDSVDADINDFQRGKKGALDASLKILSLIEKYGNGQLFTSVEAVVTQKNYGHLQELIEKMKNYPVNELRIQPVVPMNLQTYNERLALLESQIQSLPDVVAKAIEAVGSDENADAYMCVRTVSQVEAIKKGLHTGRNWGGIISPEGELRVSGYLPFAFGKISDYGSFQCAWDQGFRTGWKQLRKEDGVMQIHSLNDLQLFHKERIEKNNYEQIC